MKGSLALVVLVFIMSMTALSIADETKMDSLGRPHCIDKDDKRICHHHFELDTLRIKDILNGDCKDLMVKLMQPASRLVAEIGESLLLNAESCADAKVGVVILPKIRRITEFDLQLYKKNSDQGWEKFQSVSLLVYPKELLDPLRKWAENNLLLIKGKNEVLKTFLKKEKIEFATRKRRTEGETVVIYSEDPERKNTPHEYEEGRIIVFKETVVDLPQIRQEPMPSGPRIFVELKLFDSLESNPLAQKSFLKIFNMAMQ